MIWKPKQAKSNRRHNVTDAVRRRTLKPETLEVRRLMAADPIHIGVVYLETDYLETDLDVGGDSQPDRFILSFVGGAPDTELSELRIRTDKDADGISVGDPIFDTAPGGRGKDLNHDFQIVRVVTADGRTVDAKAEVEDGGQELVLRLSNFKAGDRLEFTLDVDEVLRNSIDLQVFNDRLDVITSGQEFQDSILEATFNAPHFESANADAIFENDYGDPASDHGLQLPPDQSDEPDSRPNRSAAAVGSIVQVPQPIDLSGYVYVDLSNDGIRDAGEAGIAGVRVQLVPTNVSDGEVLTATTAADGSYSFSGLAPGNYEVIEVSQPAEYNDGIDAAGTVAGTIVGSAINPGDRITGISLNGGDQGIEYNFGETPFGSISGFVYLAAPGTDCDGTHDAVGNAPLPGVRVDLQSELGQTLQTTTTGSAGEYVFEDLPTGNYRVVEYTPEGLVDGQSHVGRFGSVRVGTSVDGGLISQIVMTPSGSGVEYNFCEGSPATLSGYVYHDQSGDGVRDSGEESIPGTAIQLSDTNGQVVATTTTNEDGHYQFDDLPPGEYQISETQPAGYIDGIDTVGLINGQPVGRDRGIDSITEVVINQGESGTEYNFGEILPASLSGRVHVDVDGDCVYDDGEELISGVTIRLLDSAGNEVGRTLTDTSGAYTFAGLAPGVYTVIEEQPDGLFEGGATAGSAGGRIDGPDADGNSRISQIELTSGENAVQYDFCEQPPSELSGNVFADRNDDCLFDANEPGISGVLVELFDDAGTLIGSTTTDAAGNYRFTGLRGGNYTVRETHPAGYLQGGQRAGSGGGDDSVADVISRVAVGWGDRLTDYNFCELEPSSISGYVFVDGNGDCIRDEDESPIAGVLIQLRDGEGKIIGTTTTGDDGRYTFTNLTRGSYQVFEQQPDGFFHGGQTVGTGDGTVLGIDLLGVNLGANQDVIDYSFCEQAPASVSGTVYADDDGDCVHDEDEDPISGVVIQLRDADGMIVDTTTTDATGNYRFDGLRAGNYQVFEQQPDGFFQGSQTAGTGDGVVLGEDLLGIDLKAGEDLIQYDFCELRPSSISGNVWQETDLNQRYDPGDSPLPGVLIELLDESGDRIRQTRTDASGDYEFGALSPGIYGVREAQPSGLFHGGQLVGDAGGDASVDDLIVGITLVGGTTAKHYDFPEVPPATISGFVFQDGPAIVSEDQIPAVELREFRDGRLTSDDVRLESVTLELRNVLGQPVPDSRALSGIYEAGPIQVTTDADGFYEFVGLRPGTYHVYQVQPDDYVDGLDTPGSKGGVAVNPADAVDDSDRIVIQTLAASEATNPHDDAILNISLSSGESSELNNFSEIVIEQPQLPLVPPPKKELAPKVDAPIDEFDSRVRIVTFAEPLNAKSRVYTQDEWAVSWHLSVINGGVNRGTLGKDGVVRSASAKQMRDDWNTGDHDDGRWQIANQSGEITDDGDGFNLGGEDAVALTGDFDGDGMDEAVIYVGGQWFVDLNGNGKWDTGDLWVSLGTRLDRPVVGDWDGDGKDDVGIFGRRWQRDEQKIKRDPGLPDPDNKRRRYVDARTVAHSGEDKGDDRKRLMLRGDDGSLKADAVDHVFQYGEQVDTPIAGDWNGDGIDQIAVFRNGTWLLDADGDGRWTDADEKVKYGRVGDEPIVGDFNGDDIEEIGVVRGDTWIIDTDGDRRITGNDLQIQVPRSNADSQPIVGDFDGDGKDEPGYYDEAA